MIIRVRGIDYPATAVDQLSLLDLILLQEQTKAIGRELTHASVEEMEAAVNKIKHKDPQTQRELRARHPDMIWLIAIQLWATLRGAGQDVSFSEAIGIPLKDCEWRKEPGDDDDGAPVGPTRARPASGRAARRHPAAKRATKKASAKR